MQQTNSLASAHFFTHTRGTCCKELHGMQHAQPEQIKVGPTVHLSFLELQAVDLSFHLAVAPRRRKGRTHCRIIAANALGKAFELGKATVLGLCEPAIQVHVSMFCQHGDKSLAELIGRVKITVSLSDVFDLLALLLVKLFRLADTQPGGARGRHAAHELRCWRKFSGKVDGRTRGIKRKSECIASGLMLFPQVHNEASEQGSRPRIATSFDFLIELCAIATPLLPS